MTANSLSEAVLEAVQAGVALSGPKGSVNLDDLDLPGADLRDVYLRGCSMTRANLRGANLAGAVLGRLDDADLTGANLSGARLSDTRGANLSDTVLTGVRFDGALYGTTLDGADVAGTRVGQWHFNHADFRHCRNLDRLEPGIEMPGGDFLVLKWPQYYRGSDVLKMPGGGGANWRALLRARGEL
ncbi:pentapeptide repeat-containing protein [Nocardioides ganghwensis]|uniref:pentapeptide repeat-containing protein n=1 Tax=Nocardioides ganghwensis TaxID=252230 RepID=UPI001A92FD0E|nr:pentapeptide repeat-containing protein [Nocardioides ganghwensis]